MEQQINRPIRVLHVLGSLDQGGIENFIINVYRSIDRSKIQFDFALTLGKGGFFEPEILSMGGRVFYFKPVASQRRYPYICENITRIINEYGPFDVIHSHAYFASGFILKSASHRIPIRIAHAHNAYAGQSYTLRRSLFEHTSRYLLWKYGTHLLGCSNDACKYLYGQKASTPSHTRKVEIIPNGIKTDQFKYSEHKRAAIRSELQIPMDSYVIGTIGRLSKEKNHLFLVDLFYELHKRERNSYLLIVGDGPFYEEMLHKIQDLKIESFVRLTGMRSDTPALYSAMDIFVMPSFYEALGISLIEAQASGLPCFISERVPMEGIVLKQQVQSISLSEPPPHWADQILMKRHTKRNMDAVDQVEAVYDVKKTVQKLEQLYLGLTIPT